MRHRCDRCSILTSSYKGPKPLGVQNGWNENGWKMVCVCVSLKVLRMRQNVDNNLIEDRIGFQKFKHWDAFILGISNNRNVGWCFLYQPSIWSTIVAIKQWVLLTHGNAYTGIPWNPGANGRKPAVCLAFQDFKSVELFDLYLHISQLKVYTVISHDGIFQKGNQEYRNPLQPPIIAIRWP